MKKLALSNYLYIHLPHNKKQIPMYTITITHMMNCTEQSIEFTNYDKAVQQYQMLCDQHNLEISENMMDACYTAGGIGHDYRIELTVNN
jgi:hypothetical protein